MPYFAFFHNFLRNYDENVLEKSLPKMNVRLQFFIVKFNVLILPTIADLILNPKRISMIQGQIVVRTTLRINLFYKIE